MSRFCTQCGTANKDEAKFCRQCGAPIQKPAESTQADPKIVSGFSVSASDRNGAAEVEPTAAVTPSRRASTASATQQMGKPAGPPSAPQEETATRSQREHRQHDDSGHGDATGLEVDRQGQPPAFMPTIAPEIQPRPETASPQKVAPVKGRKAMILGGGTAVIAVLLAIGGGLWWSHQPSPQAAAPSPAAAPPVSAPSTPVAASVATEATPPVEAPTMAASAETPMAQPPAPPTQTMTAETPSPRHAPEKAGAPAPVTRPRSEPIKPSAPKPERSPPVATPTPPNSPAPATSPAPQPTPAPPAQPMGRLEALRAGLAACEEKGNFFAKQLCIEQTRWKYCGTPMSGDPLWGKVPECPNSAQQSSP